MTELATQTEVEYPLIPNQPDGESSGAAYELLKFQQGAGEHWFVQVANGLQEV